MSEAAPERPGGGGGNVLTRKLGPLPTWGWVGIAGLLIVAWAYYRNRQASQQQQAAPTGTNANQVPQFVNQTYTTVTAPEVVNQTPTTVTPPTVRPPVPAAIIPTEPVFNGAYTVKRGDTLESVAAKYGITREQLAHANGYGTGAGLRTGQKLKVPSPAPSGHPNPAP